MIALKNVKVDKEQEMIYSVFARAPTQNQPIKFVTRIAELMQVKLLINHQLKLL